MYVPLYRQEQERARQGLKLSRQTMSNWVLRAAEDHLLPVYEELHRQLVQHEVLHADETTLQVLYEYQPSRKAEHAAKFLEGFSGYLHADGYQGYHRLPENIRVVGCWAHARRKFDEALNTLPPDMREGTAAGALQQPVGAQHQALRDRPQELPVCQHPAGRPGQRGDLQPD